MTLDKWDIDSHSLFPRNCYIQDLVFSIMMCMHVCHTLVSYMVESMYTIE